MKLRFCVACVGLLSVVNTGYAGEQELPSTAFLEFLGQWETQNGDWVDPQTLLDLSQEEVDELATPTSDQNKYEDGN